MAEELLNENIEPIEQEDQTKSLIGLEKKSDHSLIAVPKELYSSYDNDKYSKKGIVLYNEDLELKLLIPLTGEEKHIFGEGPADIPANDKRRKNYVNPTMNNLDGQWQTQYLLSQHSAKYTDNCAVCYCANFGLNYWLFSGGEASQIFQHKEDINYLLGLLEGQTLSEGVYCLSTQYSRDYPWFINMVDGSFGFWLSKTNLFNVRPITDASNYKIIEIENK